ncbi:MAG: UbiX family flavin prenyltransferase [Verrucomicrobiae bacterium]|nr:UbiX family flavin prenyltransferase [Verrucomicrobiae bacterium]
MKVVVAITGASGSIYGQRLIELLEQGGQEVSVVLSDYGFQVVKHELGSLRTSASTTVYNNRSMNAPFASGSALYDAMVVAPCSMGTLSRIAVGTAEDLILRAADVFLKERRKLILVPRETPLNLVHARNLVAAIEIGALVIPAMPHFYSKPATLAEAVDTVVARILDALGAPNPVARRWGEDRH